MTQVSRFLGDPLLPRPALAVLLPILSYRQRVAGEWHLTSPGRVVVRRGNQSLLGACSLSRPVCGRVRLGYGSQLHFRRDLIGLPRDLTDLPRELTLLRCDFTGLPRKVTVFPSDFTGFPRDLTRFPRDLARFPLDLTRFPGDLTGFPCDLTRFPRDLTRLSRVLAGLPRDFSDLPRARCVVGWATRFPFPNVSRQPCTAG